MAEAANTRIPDPQPCDATPETDGQVDEWMDCEEADDRSDGSRRLLVTPSQDNPTREIFRQEKKKRRNKKIRKRFRRIVRASWKWFRRGFAGLSPVTSGIAMACGPVFRQGSAHHPTMYGAKS